MRRLAYTVAVLTLVVAACQPSGGPEPTDGVVQSTQTAPGQATTTEARPAEPDTVVYLTAMANGHADLVEELSAHEERTNAKYVDQAAEGDQLAYLEEYWGGMFAIALDHLRVFEDLDPPGAFTAVHAEFVAAYRALYEAQLDETESLTTLEKWEEWMSGLSEVSDELLDYVATCEQVVDTAADEGFSLDLGCPEAPPEPIGVTVEVGGAWVATPDLVASVGVIVELTITNTGDEPVRVVVVDIFEDGPLELPTGEGLVDLTQSGTSFGLAYPADLLGNDSTLNSEPPQLLPGDTVTATVHGSGPIVVFDYTDGEYEAGSYVVIERAEPRE